MEQLFAIAQKEGIKISYYNMPKPYLGMYLNDYGFPIIMLDHSLKDQPALHRCILAEEIGHHFTGIGQNIHYSAIVPFWKYKMIKCEFKALKWSATNLIPYNKLLHAYYKEGLQEITELAEYFNVTPELMEFRKNFIDPAHFRERTFSAK